MTDAVPTATMLFVPVIARALRDAGISEIVLAEFERQFSQDELRRRFGDIPLRDLKFLSTWYFDRSGVV